MVSGVKVTPWSPGGVLRTVRKHLQNAFGRLGVSSRTAAVARVFPEPEAL
ncbi:hypothetical protein ABZ307_32940 [Streptomyces griseorubiginosus]